MAGPRRHGSAVVATGASLALKDGAEADFGDPCFNPSMLGTNLTNSPTAVHCLTVYGTPKTQKTVSV